MKPRSSPLRREVAEARAELARLRRLPSRPDRERQIAAMEDILRQLDAIDAERVRRLRLEEAAAEWALSVIRRERRRRLRAAGRLVDFEEGRRTARRKKQPVN